MELSWLECLFYGLISGFTEFLPVSAVAHQTVFLKLLGRENDPWLQLAAYVGAFGALLIFCVPIFGRLRKERRIASLPKKRRRRQPDFATLMESRVFRMTTVTMLVLFLASGLVARLHQRLWLLAILMAVNGILLYVPQYLPGANKTAQSLSGLDAMLIGLAAGCGMIPGISRVGAAVSVAQIRGADRRYAAELALLISLPALAVWTVLGLIAALPTAAAVSSGLALRCLTVAAASFGAGYLGVFILRFLSVKAGIGGFAYYCWGAALFTLILYLI